MALVDDVRNLAEQAQRSLEQGAQQVQDRLDGLRRRRRFNELARQLGRAVYQARKHDQADGAEVERLCAQMAAVEAEIAAAEAKAKAAPGPPGDPPDRPPAPPDRGYSLDDI
ncbi:MAG TPA: hypothetical protein VG276_16500 [Actinomycetes bacterium]|nr:hypothetical protein [Actinomycetes bacterium]